MPVKAIPFDPLLPCSTARCRCLECGLYFNSAGAFGRHRVGPFQSLSSRRCLSVVELLLAGWVQGPKGHWKRGRRAASRPARIVARSCALRRSLVPR